MARREYAQEELLRIVVEEFDDARDAFHLASQLAPHLPIRSLDELVKATGGTLQFRDVSFDPETLRTHIPEMAFPVDDLTGLVQRIGYLIRVVPPHLGVQTDSESGARRQLKYAGQFTSGIGVIQQRGLTAIAVSPRGSAPTSVSEFDRPAR